MESSSQPSSALQRRQILEAQIRECFGRVVYTHKTHEKCADILLSRLSSIKLLQIVLSAITTGGLLLAILGDNQTGSIVGIIFSTILLVLNAYTKDYDLGELAQKHKQAASDLWLIREQYLSLITDIAAGDSSIEKIREQRDLLLEKLHTIYSGAPNTNFQSIARMTWF